jgi:hypothetical protein
MVERGKGKIVPANTREGEPPRRRAVVAAAEKNVASHGPPSNVLQATLDAWAGRPQTQQTERENTNTRRRRGGKTSKRANKETIEM